MGVLFIWLGRCHFMRLQQLWATVVGLVALLSLNGLSPTSMAKGTTIKPTLTEKAPVSSVAQTGPILTVISTDLLKDPAKYLNKRVGFEGTFNSFSSLGLDYKPAFRDSKDHVSFIVLRPDVINHTIPMSELKLIVPRKKVETVIHLDQGDKVLVKGQVFSAALGEAWLDVSDVSILKKAKGKEKKEVATNKSSVPSVPLTESPSAKTVVSPDGKPVMPPSTNQTKNNH
jgi:hypothetical protein